MSHNLNFKNGRASFFTAKEPAWHKLGIVLPGLATAEEAIKHAQLDFDVVKIPNVAIWVNNDKSIEYLPTEGSFSTVRTDNKVILGDRIGSKYCIVQNRDAFGFFDEVVGKDEAIYETAGCLNNGETVWICAKLPDYIRVGKEALEKYVLLVMTHDGTGSIKVMFTPIRVVCNNTLNAALGNHTNKVCIRHTRNAEERLRAAHKIMGITNSLSEELAQVFTQMTKVKITDKFLRGYIETIFPGEKDEVSQTYSTKMQNIHNAVYNYFEYGQGQKEQEAYGTLWGAYNAVTGYFQNVKRVGMDCVLGGAYDTGQKALDLSIQVMMNKSPLVNLN